MGVHHVKVRKVGEKRWSFLTPGGYQNHLRVHAARFHCKEVAEKVVAEISEHHPELEAKAQEA